MPGFPVSHPKLFPSGQLRGRERVSISNIVMNAQSHIVGALLVGLKVLEKLEGRKVTKKLASAGMKALTKQY